MPGDVGLTPAGWPDHGHRLTRLGGPDDGVQRDAVDRPVHPACDRDQLVQAGMLARCEPPAVVGHDSEVRAPGLLLWTFWGVQVQALVPGEGIPVRALPGG